MRTHLDLNNRLIRSDVIRRLRMMDFDIDYYDDVKLIRSAISILQFDNQLIPDGYIGRYTMPLLGYSEDDIKRMLDIPDENAKYFTIWDCLHTLFS